MATMIDRGCWSGRVLVAGPGVGVATKAPGVTGEAGALLQLQRI